jgi:cleavage and polyadenylation specificity factor subunit 2
VFGSQCLLSLTATLTFFNIGIKKPNVGSLVTNCSNQICIFATPKKDRMIRVTPLAGGKSDNGVCSLLELNGCRILLDCGFSLPLENNSIDKITSNLLENGGIDAVLLSHADLSHISGLPFILGQENFKSVPVICTLPVYKYSQLVCYDFACNYEMEGNNSNSSPDERKMFTFDDIDAAFKHVTTVKYYQQYVLQETTEMKARQLVHPSSSSSSSSSSRHHRYHHQITVTALPSGRTLGGSIWRIRCGPADVLYTIDINLKKEILLDAVSLDSIPTSPALMICDVSSASRTTSTTKKRKDKDEASAMINSVMEALRNGGNVLIPCETAGRTLEILLILHRYWIDNKLGIDHLVLLSHMSNNILEFARCQLEWMSDSLTRSFYNGKGNPFDLSYVKCFTDVRSMEKRCIGPKLVLATDSSLSFGLGKELLLKWGGDPRCRIIFIDGDSSSSSSSSGTKSFAQELKKLALTPPIITTVNVPVKINLTGKELETYRQEQEKSKQKLEEEILRKRRKEEISKVSHLVYFYVFFVTISVCLFVCLF